MKFCSGRSFPVAGLGFRLAVVAVLLLVPLLAVSCGSSSNTAAPASGGGDLMAPQQYGGSYSGGTATGDTQEGAQFAQWVMQQDPQHQYITDAVVRGDQTLGVKVQPNITKGDVQRLLVSLAQGMARTFPGKALQVIAFYQSGDKLAQANYDPNTGQITTQFF